MANEDGKFLSIDELAARDPAWRRVLEDEANTPQIKLMFFLSRITDTGVFVKDLLRLQSVNKEKLLHQKMQGVPELVSKYLGSGPQEQKAIEFVIHGMKEAFREKIENYRLWIINQALVIHCTILDTFLESLLHTVFKRKVEILYGVAAAKNIELKRLIELGSVDAAVEDIAAKEIRNFSNDTITARFEYLRTKLAIEVDRVFTWENQSQEMKTKLAGWDLEKLKGIFQKRHSIVHRDEMPLGGLSELELVGDFFTHIMTNLALLVKQKHGLFFDVDVVSTRPSRYELYQSSTKEKSSGK